jgi:hypothetical protein
VEGEGRFSHLDVIKDENPSPHARRAISGSFKFR